MAGGNGRTAATLAFLVLVYLYFQHLVLIKTYTFVNVYPPYLQWSLASLWLVLAGFVLELPEVMKAAQVWEGRPTPRSAGSRLRLDRSHLLRNGVPALLLSQALGISYLTDHRLPPALGLNLEAGMAIGGLWLGWSVARALRFD